MDKNGERVGDSVEERGRQKGITDSESIKEVTSPGRGALRQCSAPPH